MSLAAASSSLPLFSLTISTFITKVDLFLARIEGLGVGAPQPLVLSRLQLLACWEALKLVGVEWKRRGELLAWCQAQQVKHLGMEWLVPFETLLIPSVLDRSLSEEMADILGKEPMVVSGAAPSSCQQLAAKIASGKANLRRAAMESEAEQVRAAVAARERWDKRREEKKAACQAAAVQEGGDKGETGASDGAAAGASAEVPGTGADAPGAGTDAPSAGFCLHSLAIIGTWSKGASPSSPKRCQTGGAPSLAPLVSKGKALAPGVVRPKSHRADVETPLYKVPKQTTFSDDELRELLVSQCKEAKLDLGMAAGVVIDKVKGKTTVAPTQRCMYKTLKGACDWCWAENNPKRCWFLAGDLPCLCCDSLKKPCTYDGLKSQERGKANKAIERTFQKAILVW
ncbi:hypothetical protein C0992_003174 [Termitomyces sp. T32_za158]|nr:hypothetical protein C0992_003174 [Termitomyces sp. T32_za158]